MLHLLKHWKTIVSWRHRSNYTPHNSHSMQKITFILIAIAFIAVAVWGIHSALPSRQAGAGGAAPQNQVFVLAVQNRKLVSGPSLLTVHQGDTVTITITVDETEELHLHGYDQHIDVEKDVPGSLTFTANIAGSFPFELENSKTDLGTLQVLP